MQNYLSKAIFKLKPNAEFSLQDNDYSTIKWDVLDGDAPTQAEIDAQLAAVTSGFDKVIKSSEDYAKTLGYDISSGTPVKIPKNNNK